MCATRGHPLPDYSWFVLQCTSKHRLNSDLWVPFVFDVLIRGGAWDGETDDEDISLGVGQCPQPVIFLLTRCVPQVQTNNPAVYCHLNAPHTPKHGVRDCRHKPHLHKNVYLFEFGLWTVFKITFFYCINTSSSAPSNKYISGPDLQSTSVKKVAYWTRTWLL